MTHETIHSGHFMTSNPHTDPPPDDEDEDVEVDVVEDEDKSSEKGLMRKESVATDERPVTFYKFGPTKTQSFAIDVSLNKLNRCIRVAYNKMTTPKWKDFKGLRLHWKQRIRLNNVIWRAYHMEFGRPNNKGKKTPYCYFAVPDDDTTHLKIEGTVLEGMYWKRRVEAVCAQYKRWRHYFRPKHHFHPPEGQKRALAAMRKQPLLASKYVDSFGKPSTRRDSLPTRSQTPKNTSTEYFDIDDLENEFTDTLFESLNGQPYMFPNPREFGNSYAEIMQPGLLSLQPSLEDIMSSFFEDETNSFLDLPGTSNSSFALPPSPTISNNNGLQQGANSSSSSSSSQQQRLHQLQQRPPTCAAASSGARGGLQQAPPQSQSQGHPVVVPRRVAPLPPFKRIPPQYSPTPSPTTPIQQVQQQQQQQQRQSIYSPKDYLAASTLVEYSNHSPSRSSMTPTTTSLISSTPLQPTRQSSSLGSPMMLSQPQYSTATGYGSGSIDWKPPPPPLQQQQQQLQQQLLMGSINNGLGQGSINNLSHLGLAAAANANGRIANNFLVTGGDVATMDYMPQFLSGSQHAGAAAYRLPSASGLQAAVSPLSGIPGISVASSSSVSIGSPAGSAFAANSASRWWESMSQQQPSTSSGASPCAGSVVAASPSPLIPPSPISAAAAARNAASGHLQHLSGAGTGTGGGHHLIDAGLMPSPSSSTSTPIMTPPPPQHSRSLKGNGALSAVLQRGQTAIRSSHSIDQLSSSSGVSSPSTAAPITSSLPRDSLSDRLGLRSSLVDAAPSTSSVSASTLQPNPGSATCRMSVLTKGGAAVNGGSLAVGAASRLVAGGGPVAPMSAPAETTENPWDREDPGTSGLFLRNGRTAESCDVKDELIEEKVGMGGGTSSGGGGGGGTRGGKRGTKQVPADSTLHPTERKRILHLHAEQSRRIALKDGFDQLMDIVPDVHSGGVKPTNAVVLAKAADHIKHLLAQKNTKAKRIAEMKDSIKALNERISSLQSSLPSSRRDDASAMDQKTAIEQFYERYTKERTKEDWRFWLMAHLFKPMVANYATHIHSDPADRQELAVSAASWMAANWRVSRLRPLSSEVLVYLATNTRVLQDPHSLREHIEDMVQGNK